MFTINSNEKLGMSVENVRLSEIRQEIDVQRLGNEIQQNRFGMKSLMQKVSGFVAARNTQLPTVSTQSTTVAET